ncbi:MAG: hypothetical protein KGJ78_01720 [Alphaproteobacteria bacterium]|nr:hypothetical protein [Alphaproteobacteria bacterium]
MENRDANKKFAILRRETSGGYSTRGPIAQVMTLDQARNEVARLKGAYPHQDFVIMGEIGEVTRSERVTVKIEAPDLSRKVRKKKLAQPAFTENVVPIRNGGTGA